MKWVRAWKANACDWKEVCRVINRSTMWSQMEGRNRMAKRGSDRGMASTAFTQRSLPFSAPTACNSLTLGKV